MTKLKSKKMNKSTIAIIVMAILMVGMLAFGGIYAYFTASTTDRTGTFTTGHVKLTSEATFITLGTKLLPGDTVVEDVQLTTDTEGTDSYVAVQFTIKVWFAGTSTAGSPDLDSSLDGIDGMDDVLTFAMGSNWQELTGVVGGFFYGTASTAATAVVDNTTLSVVGDIIFNADDEWIEGNSSSEEGYMGATIEVVMKARSIQAKNLTGINALTELVGLF